MPLVLLSSNLVLLAFGTWLAYGVLLAIYRLFFHPLAKFPGNKLAAATGWYECYHDVVRRGMYVWKIQEWHNRYGTQFQ